MRKRVYIAAAALVALLAIVAVAASFAVLAYSGPDYEVVSRDIAWQTDDAKAESIVIYTEARGIGELKQVSEDASQADLSYVEFHTEDGMRLADAWTITSQAGMYYTQGFFPPKANPQADELPYTYVILSTEE